MELVICIIPNDCICRSDEGVVSIEAGSRSERKDYFLLSVICKKIYQKACTLLYKEFQLLRSEKDSPLKKATIMIKQPLNNHPLNKTGTT